VLVVSGIGAHAKAARALRAAAGGPSGDDWIGQKQNKSGKREASDQDRPVPHVEAKNSTLRHFGDELRHDLTSEPRHPAVRQVARNMVTVS
jgi:hypothetical protein